MAAKPKGSTGSGKPAARRPESVSGTAGSPSQTSGLPDAVPGPLPGPSPDPLPDPALASSTEAAAANTGPESMMHETTNATGTASPAEEAVPPELPKAASGNAAGEAAEAAPKPSPQPSPKPSLNSPPKSPPKDALIEALMELAGERVWEDITLSDIATRANLGLADFRDAFPSKGAVLAGFSRKIDRIVLEGTGDDLAGEPAKERLFDVLMRRLDALAPYKLGLESVAEWLGRAPLAAAAVNRLEVNSMRFMLEAAGIDTEGSVGAVKLQGVVLAWGRVIRVWLRDDDPSLSKTMNVLDRELTRGARIVGRVDDVNRLVSPLLALTKAMFERRPDYPRETGRPAEEPASF